MKETGEESPVGRALVPPSRRDGPVGVTAMSLPEPPTQS